MKEFAASLADTLNSFPDILKMIFISALGALCACIVMIIREIQEKRRNEKATMSTAGEILGRFVVSWIVGCFGGQLIGPSFQALVKISDNTITFIAGGSGYVIMDKVILKKAEKLGDESTGDTPTKPTESA